MFENTVWGFVPLTRNNLQVGLLGFFAMLCIAALGSVDRVLAASVSEGTSRTETGTGQSAPAEVRATFDPLPSDPESQALKDRVDARWKAVVDRDYKEAYAFESPAFRDRYTVDQYASKFGPNVHWHMATVKRIRYDQRGAAKVLVEIDHDFFPPQGDQPVRSQAYLEEDWVNIDGQWWRNATQKEFGLPTE